ncbi:hypothetical protein GCM10007938_39780 [Vibrio zhanjiangensis]|uniref:Uncharacterized protein n=1 Tax=Vibrio zhanjiangensis TaxID=1046128 RepID=A0ABQ6F6H8_9VIBR|nr:hypothetical protein GCM10007938_39780 [Vibrio zhanjiangensis]
MIKEMVLFTHPVTSLWDVNPKFSKSYAEFMLERLTALEIATKKDDPYADLALLNIEQALYQLESVAKEGLSQESDRAGEASWLDLQGRCLCPDRHTPAMGWLMLRVFGTVDQALVQNMIAFRTASVTRAVYEKRKSQLVKALHAMMNVFHRFRFHTSGLNRETMAQTAPSPKRDKVIKRLGVLPLEIMDSIERADHAPYITRRN